MSLRFFEKSLFLLIVLAPGTATAEDIRSNTSLGVSVSQSYTDNRCLSKTDKEGDWSTSVNLDSGGGLGYSREGGRASLKINGSVQLNARDVDRRGCDTSSTNRGSRITPRIKADGKVELVEQILFIDASASARQNSIDPFSISDESNLNTRENTNTTYNYKISPYITGRVKDVAKGKLRLTYDNQINSEDEVDDSTRKSAILTVDSITNSKLSWGLSGSYARDNYDRNNFNSAEEENDFASASARLGYQLNRKWQLYATTGKDFNDFNSVLDENDGSFWSAGINWTPNPRTTVEADFGERFFGSSDSLSITHKSRRSRFTAKYEKVLTSSRFLREEDVFFQLQDAQGNPIVFNNGQAVIFSTTATTLTRSPIIDERVRLGYTLQGRRTRISIDSSLSKQYRTEDGFSSEFSDVTLSGNRTLSRNTKLNARISYRERSADEGSELLGDDSKSWVYNLGISRDFGQRTRLSFDYVHTDRQSDSDDNEYKENRIIATIRVDL